VLAVIAGCSLGYVHSVTNEEAYDIEVTEKTLYGDASTAQGVYATVASQYERHLNWTTGFYVSEEPEENIDYEFSTSRYEYGLYDVWDKVGLTLDVMSPDFSIGFSGSGLTLDGEGETMSEFLSSTDSYDWIAILSDVYDEMAEEGVTSKVVDLSDYFEYYPIYADWWGIRFTDVNTDGTYGNGDYELSKFFAEVFKVPVEEGTMIEVSFTRDEYDGSVSEVDQHFVNGGVYAYYSYVTADDGIYFMFSLCDNDGNLLDMSQVAGGYGLYYLPFEDAGENKEKTALIDELTTVVSFDPKTSRIESVESSPDKKTLFLLVDENGKYFVYTIDSETGEILNTIDMELDDDTSFYTTIHNDGYSLYISNEGEIRLITNDSGEYELTLSGSAPQIDGDDYLSYLSYLYYGFGERMVWDGEKLSLITSERMDFGDFYIMTFDRTGLLYLGQYNTSQQNERITSGTNYQQNLNIYLGKM
jgi:hypothetical protein